MTSKRKMDQILEYASRGWPVFPVSFKKTPLTPHGCKDASTDIATIEKWWTEKPTANVAIATGKIAGLVVVDIDIKQGKDGLESLYTEFGEHLDLNPCNQLIARTPSGGIHVYYRWDDQFSATVAAGVLTGVDIRGEGGYVLAPPSVLRLDDEWKPYRWDAPTLPVPALSDWAKELLQRPTGNQVSQPTPASRSAFDVGQVITGITEGRRDDYLFRYACHLRGCGIPYELASGFIQEAAARCSPPFPQDIAIEKIKRAYTNVSINPYN